MFKDFIDKFKSNKKLILKTLLSLMEITCFIIFVVYSVLLIGALNAEQIYQTGELGINQYFLGVVISGFLFLVGPFVIKKIIVWADEQIKILNLKELKNNFLREITGKSNFSIDELAEKYELSNQDVKDYLMELMERGVIKGLVEKTITGLELFKLKPGYIIDSPDEHKLAYFNSEISNYLSSYTKVSLKKIGDYFNLKSEKVERLLKKKIEAQEIEGYLDEGYFYRDWPHFVKEMTKKFQERKISCPHCSNETYRDRPFCCWCGERLEQKKKEL